VPDPLEAAKFLDVEVDHFAGLLSLVAADRLSGFQRVDPVETKPLEMRLTVGGEMPSSAAICLPVCRIRRSAAARSTTACGVGQRSRCGRELRSRKPATPSLPYRSTHLRTVRLKRLKSAKG
jgi:hypothetical protein